MFVMQDSYVCGSRRIAKQRIDRNQDMVSPEFDLTQRRAAAQVDAKGKYEPCLSEHGIPNDVLATLQARLRFRQACVRRRELWMCSDCTCYPYGDYRCEN